MKSTPFNPDTDNPALPFNKDICNLARELKRAGLNWHPHVGCFVWDPDHYIDVPSPFPGRIYFILNLNHFVRIFGDLESVTQKLVWLPTWHQSRLILREMHHDLRLAHDHGKSMTDPLGDFIYIYEEILRALKRK